MKPFRNLLVAASIAAASTLPAAHAADPVDADTAISQGSSVDPSSGTNGEQLQKLMKDAEQHAAEDAYDTKQQAPAEMWMLGVGDKTCKQWTASNAGSLDWQAQEWAQGYWTGLNTLNAGDHNVGKSMRPEEIIAEIKAKCSGNPGKTLQIAVSEAYVEALRNQK